MTNVTPAPSRTMTTMGGTNTGGGGCCGVLGKSNAAVAKMTTMK